MEKEEVVYDFHSLSLRLIIMEVENKLLKKIQSLENENLCLKTNIDEIKTIKSEQKKSSDKNKMDFAEKS